MSKAQPSGTRRSSLSVFVQGHRAGGCGAGSEQSFDMAHGLRPQEHVTTDRADFCGHVIDDDDPPLVTDRMSDFLVLILAGTTLDTAIHGLSPLWVGVTHLGGFGS